MAQISDKEYKMFSEQLAQRFERKIKGRNVSLPLPDTLFGVKLVSFPLAKDVKNIAPSFIKENEIYFHSKDLEQGVYNLLRHFRNCASHHNAITKRRKGNWFYLFEDRGYVYGKPYVSMRGNVSQEKWETFIEELYKEVLKRTN